MGISRPVSFKYRSKLPNHFWRRFWDWMVFIGGFFPALIFGLLIGNTLEGVPFYLDNDLRIFYTGSFFDLFNPFALWCAFTSLAMLSMHGGLYLALKTTPPIRERAIRYAKWMAVLFLLLFAGGGIWIAHSVHGFEVVSGVDPFGYSNPLHKTIATNLGAWLKNYSLHPYTMLAPVIGLLGGLGVILTARLRSAVLAFIFSSFAIMGVIATVGVSMFPFILPSSTNFSSSLLVWDASSSQLTLLLMLIAVIIFLPLILFYTAWVYRSLSGVVDRKMIEQDENHIAY